MRRKAKTPEIIERDKVFAEVKDAKGFGTILDEGFQDLVQKFEKAYVQGMKAQDVINILDQE